MAHRCHIPQCIARQQYFHLQFPSENLVQSAANSKHNFQSGNIHSFKMADQAWKKFTTAMSNKRTGKKTNKPNGGNATILKKGELVVQRLSSDVQGKAQKYARVGPREFVSFPYEAVTIKNLKEACYKHFKSRIGDDMVCDIIAGDQGPSCSSVEQIPSFNVIHVRFVVANHEDPTPSSHDSCPWEVDTVSSCPTEVRNRNKRPRPLEETASLPNPKYSAKETSSYPKSLSVLEMLKLGTVIKGTSTSFDLYEFNVQTMTWTTKPITVEFVVEEDVLGVGGFREVFKATVAKSSNDTDTTWVIKKYLPGALTVIDITKQTVEEHTKKVVQMHMLAKNLAEQLKKKLKEDGKLEDYGQTLQFKKIYMAQPGNIIVEEFVEGEFVKFLNNTGAVCGNDSELRQKAESLTHFSYEKSNKQLMIVDIQGCGYDLYDPEIASKA
jgi:hypothetical protein